MTKYRFNLSSRLTPYRDSVGSTPTCGTTHAAVTQLAEVAGGKTKTLTSKLNILAHRRIERRWPQTVGCWFESSLGCHHTPVVQRQGTAVLGLSHRHSDRGGVLNERTILDAWQSSTHRQGCCGYRPRGMATAHGGFLLSRARSRAWRAATGSHTDSFTVTVIPWQRHEHDCWNDRRHLALHG